MVCLGRVELPDGKGDRHGLVTMDETTGCQLLAFVWSDRDRRHFISTCSSLASGAIIERTRWKQIDLTPNAAPERRLFTVDQPKACETYYSSCGMIDRHNRSRQSSLMIEKKVKVTTFDKRLNTTLFAIAGPVDAWFLFRGIRVGQTSVCLDERHFYEALCEQLIDNKLDSTQASTRANKRRTNAETLLQEQEAAAAAAPDVVPSHLQLLSVTPTKRSKTANANHRLQGRCLVCNKPASAVCRTCQRGDPHGKHQHWICDKPGKICMGKHIMANHPDMLPSVDKKRIDWNHVI